ncbi:phospholipase D family protein [Klebsiella michiganensis]|uniref:phospholipase D family nuclease n=1 Tax=Klebsiella michiganensis TaxID=1134687 RepID=UPI003DAA1934
MASPAPPDIAVGFSPHGSARSLVLQTVNDAQSSVRMMAYALTDPDVIGALVAAHRRGVDVAVVIDQRFSLSNPASREAVRYLVTQHVPVRTVSAWAIHHDKVIIADGHTVETGSYNYTRAAVRNNSENVVVLRHMPDIAALYLTHWQSRWERGRIPDITRY